MDLIFNLVDGKYESEFEMTADCNLHIEFESATPFKLYQKTAGTGYDLVEGVKGTMGKVTDFDLQALVYPKYIKVVCANKPSVGVVTIAE